MSNSLKEKEFRQYALDSYKEELYLCPKDFTDDYRHIKMFVKQVEKIIDGESDDIQLAINRYIIIKNTFREESVFDLVMYRVNSHQVREGICKIISFVDKKDMENAK